MYRTKEELLEQAASKDAHEFLQIDGFTDQQRDDVMHPDPDGDWICYGMAEELRNMSDIVRIQIPWNADGAKVQRVLEKMVRKLDAALTYRDEHRGLLLPAATRESVLNAIGKIGGDPNAIEVAFDHDVGDGTTIVAATLHGENGATARVLIQMSLWQFELGIGCHAYPVGDASLRRFGNTHAEAAHAAVQALIDKLRHIEIPAERLELLASEMRPD